MGISQISKLSKGVFVLESIEQTILKFFSVNGPGNQNEITKFVTNSEDHKKWNRWSIRRKILGSKTIFGLVPGEYIFEKPAGKYRWRKQEKTYYLTLKGILASLSFNIKFEKSYPFEILFDFIGRHNNSPEIIDLAKKYIGNQINFFLAWHVIRGFQLNKLSASYAYYRIFVNENWKDTVSVLPFDEVDKKKVADMIKITSDYIFTKDRLTKLENEKHIPDIPIFYYYPARDTKDFRKPDSKHNISLIKFIRNWYNYVETLQVIWYNEKYDHLESNYFDEIPYSGSYKEFNDKVEKELHALNSKS